MKKSALIVTSLAMCLLTFQAGSVRATSGFRNSWKAFYPDVCQELTDAANDCTLCHTSVPTRNPYGTTLESKTYAQAASIDSDGDGRTNGEEILMDCTMPGDMASPDDLDTWGAIKVLFR